jgi:hypothetical protein
VRGPDQRWQRCKSRRRKGQGSNAPGGANDYIVNGNMTGGFAFVAYPARYGKQLLEGS